MKNCKYILLLAVLMISGYLAAGDKREFSVAGFYDLANSGREVYNFNVGWRFIKSDVKGADQKLFDDSKWTVVNLPHTVELMPVEASGCRNYQGPVWYRKHFVLDKSFAGKLATVYFEAAMGKSQVYVNGKFVCEHIGGYLPFSIELSALGIKPGEECVIALRVDNSDDKSYPPGKQQNKLDFTYFGGIYRDCWLISTDRIHISDANAANRTAGGGVFAHVENLSEKSVDVIIKTDIQNDSPVTGKVSLLTTLKDPSGKIIKTVKSGCKVAAKSFLQKEVIIKVNNPDLWSPETPSLYTVETKLVSADGKNLDGGITRVGLKKIEFRGKQGFFLNGKKYDKLIGANRHQDFAYVGNAMPNSQHWRDAKKLRDAGCRVIRTAHYPQDPSFMDACDELGLFVIVAIPGWQYFNKDSTFSELCYKDLRNIIRRDRNHACIMMWEPILNETPFPESFSLKTLAITHEEYPYYGTFSAADGKSPGVKDNYDVVYGFPDDLKLNYSQPMFTREWGEYVDDWYAHNTPNRVSRSWGEIPQIVQATHLAMVYDEMCNTPDEFIGGALWHPFDHQRGYHPDTYWGGLLDAFRQPKYSFEMFKSQVRADYKHPLAKTGPMLFVAHELTPFSNPDIVVFTNCDSVRLIRYETDTFIVAVNRLPGRLPNPPVVFKDVFDFYKLRYYTYTLKKWQQASFVFEGIIGGKVVCSYKKMPSRRSTQLRLSIDNEGQALRADGSDFAVVVCEVTDDNGNVRRLAKENVFFEVEGEGVIVGDFLNGANPRAVEFGSAPVLIRSTVKPGKVTVRARVLFEGENTPKSAEISFESVSPAHSLVYRDLPAKEVVDFSRVLRSYVPKMSDAERQKALEEVEKQQTQFGETF
jgi:beta-galactosidase